jgi:thioredoxin 1
MIDTIAAQKTFEELIASGEPVLIDFYADWSPPSLQVKPIIDEIKRKLGRKVIVLKINIDKNPRVARLYNIYSVPTLMLFKDSEIKWRQTGVLTPAAIEKIIRENR